MFRKSTALLAALFIAGCVTTAGPQNAVESWPPPNGKGLALNSQYKPIEGTAPRPAVVLLHGCGGWYGDRLETWGSWFNARGYHALAIDSFEARGVYDGICTDFNRVPVFFRVSDAYGALSWLANRPEVDASNVIVMGFSNGGTTALTSISAGYEPKGVPENLRFRAALPFYPGCAEFVNRGRVDLNAPTLIVVGSNDSWTKPGPCLDAAKNNVGAHPLKVHVIEGASHAFDMFRWKSRSVGPRRVAGHSLAPSAAATEEARRTVEDFLKSIGMPATPTS